MVRTIIGMVLILVLAVSAQAEDDLYLITVNDSHELGSLVELDSRVVHYGSDGLVVLIDDSQSEQLGNSGLSFEMLAQSITVDQLATDARRVKLYARGFQPLYEDGGFRLYLLDAAQTSASLYEMEMQPLQPGLPLSEYQPVSSADGQFASPDALMDLDSLIGLVSMDSIWSYVSQLQGLAPRVAGTASNRNARDWIKSQFESFGYFDVRLDTFNVELAGVPSECYNVVVTKTGTKYPDRKVVVGAHFDAVAGSPGADDNGSGSSGVLEIARVLKDIDTDMTFEFVLYDAEEFGLYGAWHHATQAWMDSVNIVFMLNMDMIGYIANTTQGNVFYGADNQYAVRYLQLADSLVGLTVLPQGGSSASDHYPYTQFGIPVAFVSENAFSTVYHTYQDSTSYLSPSYMTKLVRSSLATAYWVSQAEGPTPSLEIEYTSVPVFALPDETTSIELSILPVWDGVITPGSEQIHYQVDGGTLVSETLTSLGGGVYTASLPAADCGSSIDYYVSAVEDSAGLISYPDPAEPNRMIVATDYLIDFADNFETDLGWTTSVSASSGQWQRGVPVNDLNWGYDPMADGDGSGACFLTQNQTGNTDVDGGSVRLVSPVIDFSAGGSIEYYYYLLMTNPASVDRLLVEGNDGDGVWREIIRHTENVGIFWAHQTIAEADVIAAGLGLTSTLQIRFTANDSDPQSIVEAGVDGFKLTHFDCEMGCCGIYNAGETGNTNCDVEGKISLADITRLIDRVYISKIPLCCEENGNTSGDPEGLLNLADITTLIDNVYITKGQNAACL